MDRTNWEFGKTTINILMISVIWNGIGIPLIWALLPTAGNSNTQARTDLLDRLSKPQHAAQMQVYMHLTGISRALYVAVCKDTDALHIERVDADKDMAERLIEKAGRVIFAQRPPSRISEDPAWYECRMCAHHDVCHGGGAAAVNCRTCLHATPVEGGWHCARHDRMQASQEQRGACERHLFITDLVPGEVTDAGDDHITYRMKDGAVWVNDARAEKEVTSC